MKIKNVSERKYFVETEGGPQALLPSCIIECYDNLAKDLARSFKGEIVLIEEEKSDVDLIASNDSIQESVTFETEKVEEVKPLKKKNKKG